MSYNHPLEIDEDLKQESDEEGALNGNKSPNYKVSNCGQKLMSSPIMSPSRNYKSTGMDSIYSKPIRMTRFSNYFGDNLENLKNDHENYAESDDEDYYPTSSDVYSEDEENEIERSDYGQRIQPEVSKMEQIVIISTLIGTALGVIIGYILFLSENGS